jgi:hypothetical protein
MAPCPRVTSLTTPKIRQHLLALTALGRRAVKQPTLSIFSPQAKRWTAFATQRRELTSIAQSTHSSTEEAFDQSYEGGRLDQIAFPLGGIGAGMLCFEGTGPLSGFSFRHRPNLTADRRSFAAITINQGTVQDHSSPGRSGAHLEVASTIPGHTSEGGVTPVPFCGLPRFRNVTFDARFPFATISLADSEIPLRVELTAWSPFTPSDSDNYSLPVAGLEYRFANLRALVLKRCSPSTPRTL